MKRHRYGGQPSAEINEGSILEFLSKHPQAKKALPESMSIVDTARRMFVSNWRGKREEENPAERNFLQIKAKATKK